MSAPNGKAPDLLILSPHLAPPAGGVQRLAADIKAAFPDRDVRLLGVSAAPSSEPGVRTVRGNLGYLAATISELRRRPRLVHAMTWRAALPLLAFRGNAPTALYCHGAELIRGRGGPVASMLRRLVLRRVSVIVANSQFTADLVRDLVGRDATVVHPPLGEFPETSPVTSARDGVAILSVGRLVANKGHDRLLRAIADVRHEGIDARVRIVGTGPAEPQLRALIRELRLEDAAVLAGGVDDHALAAAYRATDIFALLSVPVGDEVEGFGIVYLEAAAYGLPSIAGRSGGAQEAVVDGETGFVVDDHAQAVDALRRLATDAALRTRLGEAGRARVDAFRLPQFREQLERAYASAR